MTPYKGIVRISCTKKKHGCLQKLQNVEPGCMACASGLTEILDLEGRVVAQSSKLKAQGSKLKAKEAQSSKLKAQSKRS